MLDDITSALDIKTEQKVLKNIYNFTKEYNITTLISAQKITSLSLCDRIIVMNKGKIENIGRHKELESKSYIYNEIKKLQKQVK